MVFYGFQEDCKSSPDQEILNGVDFLDRECEEGSDKTKSTWYTDEDVFMEDARKQVKLIFCQFCSKNSNRR